MNTVTAKHILIGVNNFGEHYKVLYLRHMDENLIIEDIWAYSFLGEISYKTSIFLEKVRNKTVFESDTKYQSLLDLTDRKNLLENMIEDTEEMSEVELISCNKSLNEIQNKILEILDSL